MRGNRSRLSLTALLGGSAMALAGVVLTTMIVVVAAWGVETALCLLRSLRGER